jgi:hypothetical protein
MTHEASTFSALLKERTPLYIGVITGLDKSTSANGSYIFIDVPLRKVQFSQFALAPIPDPK